MISYGLGGLGGGALENAFAVRAYAFYENEVLLAPALIILAWVLYSIWNAINDPLAGYLPDRTWGFTRCWGRRIPWIAMCIGPFSLFYVLTFTPPDPTNQVSLFLWFLLIICLFDTFYTIWGLNYSAVLPEKFRTDLERNKVVSIKYIFSMLGLVVGFIVPPLFIEYGNRGSYVIAAVVITVFCVVALLAQIHGCRDTPDMIQAAIKQAESKTVVPSFSTSFKQVFARKNSRTLLIVNMCFQSVQTIVLASVAYYVQSVLQLEADFEIALLGVVIVSIVLSIPVWSYFMRRFGARKTLLVGAPFSIFGLFLVILPVDLLGTLLAMAFIGFGVGGGLISQDVAYADVIDEDTSIHKTRREGLYYGVNGFMIRLSLLFQVIAFSLIHFLTNYVPGSAVQSAEAIFGIRLQFGFVPLIFMTIVLFLVWKFYDLGPAKVQQIKAQVAELGL